MRVVYLGIFLLGFFNIKSVYSSNMESKLTADIQAYCQYIAEKQNAKKSILLSPDVIVRAQNATNDFPYQNNLIMALSKDLADFGKSKQIDELIKDECNFYKLTQEANLQIQYAIPNLQQQALLYKLKKIQEAENKLDARLQRVKKKLINQNETLTSWYKMESFLQKLEEEKRNIQANLAIQSPPPIKTIPLNQLLQQVWMAEKKKQSTLNKLAKLRNWSVQVQAGAQKSLSSLNSTQNTQPYGALFLRYNLGSLYSDSQTDHSLNHFSNWKAKQVTGTQQQLSRLIRSVSLLKVAEKQRLDHLIANYQLYYGLAKKLNAVDSFKANRFKQQIEIDQIMMQIEISYLTYLTHLLKEIV